MGIVFTLIGNAAQFGVSVSNSLVCILTLNFVPGICPAPPLFPSPTSPPTEMPSPAPVTAPPISSPPTPSPTAAPTAPRTRPTLRPSGPTSAPTPPPSRNPTPMPTTQCNQLDTPPSITLTANSPISVPAMNQPIPPSCVFSACTTAVVGSLVYLAQISVAVPGVRLQVSDGTNGLNVGLVLTQGVDSPSAFCGTEIANPGSLAATEISLDPVFLTGSLNQYLVVAPSANSGPLADGSSIDLNVMEPICGSLVSNPLDMSTPGSQTFSAQVVTVPATCPIRTCTPTNGFETGDVSIAFMITTPVAERRGFQLQLGTAPGVNYVFGEYSTILSVTGGDCFSLAMNGAMSTFTAQTRPTVLFFRPDTLNGASAIAAGDPVVITIL